MKELLKKTLGLPDDAVEWLMMGWHAIQTFDDFADGDKVDRKDVDTLLWNLLIAMPQNSFYFKHSQLLWPVMATAILKWQASDAVERKKEANAMSFSWRASFYDVVLFVYSLIHGSELAIENAHVIMGLYGETFDDYLKEYK